MGQWEDEVLAASDGWDRIWNLDSYWKRLYPGGEVRVYALDGSYTVVPQ